MNKKHCLLVISGQTRELPRAISSIRAFATRLKHINPVTLSVLFVTWDQSYSFFPNEYIKSYITDVTDEYVRNHVIDGEVFGDANTTIRIVPSYNIDRTIAEIARIPVETTRNQAEFARVAYLNNIILKESIQLEKRQKAAFDYVIKIRPDLFIEDRLSLDLSENIDNELYTNIIEEGPPMSLGDFFLVFGRTAFHTYCNLIHSMPDMWTIGAHTVLGELRYKGVQIRNIKGILHKADFLEVIPIRPAIPFIQGEVTSYIEGVRMFQEWETIWNTRSLEDEIVQHMLNSNIKFTRIGDSRMKVIIPMAGLGSRFSEKGHDIPKPLIEFLGKPMIQHVVEHLGLANQYEHIFLCQKEHIDKYKLHELFSTFVPKFQIIPVFGVTNGAATTVHRALTRVGPKDPVLIVNSDQLVHWDKRVDNLDSDGTIFCFPGGTGPKWSYAAIDETGQVTKVAEKVQISEHATTGMYYWKTFKQYLDAYQKMVAANDRVNNEFYVAPVYNYALDQKITIKYIHHVDQVGTPEELNDYLSKTNKTDSKISSLLNTFDLK